MRGPGRPGQDRRADILIGSQIRHRRLAGRLAARDVAVALGISEAALAAFENGSARIAPGTLRALAEIFGTTPGELLGPLFGSPPTGGAARESYMLSFLLPPADDAAEEADGARMERESVPAARPDLDGGENAGITIDAIDCVIRTLREFRRIPDAATRRCVASLLQSMV